jgi:hypothetical protein
MHLGREYIYATMDTLPARVHSKMNETRLDLVVILGLPDIDGRAYFHTSYLYILKHFETFPHICVKIRSPVWLSLFSHQLHKAGKRITESSHHLGTMNGFGSGFGSGLGSGL